MTGKDIFGDVSVPPPFKNIFYMYYVNIPKYVISIEIWSQKT